MSITPVEIRHIRLGRRLLGYERDATDRLLAEVAASFEDVWRERADLRDEMERLEAELQRQREIEEALRNTLLSAERMADELRARAHRESDLIVEEARAKAREITGGAEAERERVRGEIRRLRSLENDVRARYRTFLVTALERLEADSEDAREQGHQAA
ncbi:MAG TPA: DivIVA domain-containing protein [Gaiellaceae bacterium]|nr:DivIVA domain-containing protein [Gaiellaceae bacterium]